MHFVQEGVANHHPLRHSSSRTALADHVDDEDKGVTKCYTSGGEQEW